MCNVRITFYNVKYTIIVPLFYFKKVMRVQLYTGSESFSMNASEFKHCCSLYMNSQEDRLYRYMVPS